MTYKECEFTGRTLKFLEHILHQRFSNICSDNRSREKHILIYILHMSQTLPILACEVMAESSSESIRRLIILQDKGITCRIKLLQSAPPFHARFAPFVKDNLRVIVVESLKFRVVGFSHGGIFHIKHLHHEFVVRLYVFVNPDDTFLTTHCGNLLHSLSPKLGA